jgi:4-phosphopantoate--beta-alanine ligase
MNVPPTHPRYRSLVKRETLVSDVAKGIVHLSGLIAQGRGETFDYILGERTIEPALRAISAASAALVLASRPVLSVNGNVASLVPKEMIALARAADAKLEVNLFNRTQERVWAIQRRFRSLGAQVIVEEDARIPGLDHQRAVCSKEGMYSADVVLVPLEDGDRTEALKRLGKFVITIDLNPLSRTAKAANITIVDELTRAMPLLDRKSVV